MHADDDAKVQRQQPGDDSSDSLPDGDPDDRNETHIKVTVAPVVASEHGPANDKDEQSLAAGFCHRTQGEPRLRSLRRRPSGWGGRRREPLTNPGKYMDE